MECLTGLGLCASLILTRIVERPLLGQFEFTISPDVAGDDLRALRDSNAFPVVEAFDEFMMVSA